MEFHFEISDREEPCVLSLFGDFDLAAAATLPDWGASFLEAHTIVVDLSGLTFMDSTGLREVLRLHDELEAAGKKMLVKGVAGSHIDRLFDLTGVRDRLTFVPD